MKTLIQKYPQAITTIAAILVIASAITLFLMSIPKNELFKLINY